MKIALVAPVNPYVSCGATNNIVGLKDGFEKLGHEAFLIGFRKVIGDKKLEKKDAGMKNIIQVPYYNIVPRRYYSIRDFFDRRWQFAATRALQKLHRKEKIDIIVMRFGYYPYFTMNAMKEDGFSGKIAVLSYPFIVGQSQLGRISKRVKNDIRKFEKLSLIEADTILAYSPPVADIIASDYGIPRGEISITRPGADLELFRTDKNYRKTLGWDQNVIIGFIGSLIRWQGIEHLIGAMPRVLEKNRKALLVIIGDAPDARYRDELVGLAKKLDIAEKVKFYPPVPRDEVPLYLNSFDVFAAPYAKTDPPMSIVFPIKCAEAIAAGCRIVTTDQPGLSWIIKDGENGMLAEPNSAESIAEKILCITENNEVGARLSAGARKTSGLFDWKVIAKDAVDSIMKNG